MTMGSKQCNLRRRRVLIVAGITTALFFRKVAHRIPDGFGGINTSADDENKKGRTFYVTSTNNNLSLPLAKSLLNEKASTFEEYEVIFQLSPNITKSPNTIVTAFFSIPSKHTSVQYDMWMKNFLSLQDHMVIFTQPECFAQIKQARSHAMDRTVIILIELDETPFANLFPEDFWKDQLARDPEQARHQSYQLFQIWLTKPWFVMEGIRLNFFQSNLFLWIDIGCFWKTQYNSKTLVLHRELVPNNEMLFVAFQEPNPPTEDMFADKVKYEKYFYHAGSQMAGFTNTWKEFYVYFLDMIDSFLDNDMLLVDDQVILQSVCLSHPKICAYVRSSEVNDRRYHTLRYVLHHGGEYNYWRYNKTLL